MSFQAFGNYIVVKEVAETERLSNGGIVLPSDVKEQVHSRRLEIVSVSDTLRKWMNETLGNARQPNVGDIIHCKFHAGTTIWVEGQEYTVLSYEELLIIES